MFRNLYLMSMATATLTITLSSLRAQTNLPLPKCPPKTQPAIVTQQIQTKISIPPVIEHNVTTTSTTVKCVPKTQPPAPAARP